MDTLYYHYSIMKGNESKPADCNKTCNHPNGRVSFVFVEKDKNFTEAKSYCEEMNGRLADDLNKEAYKTIQSCCKSNYSFRIGLIQDKICANNNTHPFRWLSQINRCRKFKALNLSLTNNASTDNSICKTALITAALSQTKIPKATLDNCNKI